MAERPRRLLNTLLRLSVREWRDLIGAQIALFHAWRTVRTRPVGDLIRVNAGGSHQVATAPALADAELRASELALAVERVAENGPFRPACLVRALAIQQMLESQGIGGSRVRVGVRQQSGQFTAHAWVEYGSLVLGDQEGHIAGFADLDLDVAARG